MEDILAARQTAPKGGTRAVGEPDTPEAGHTQAGAAQIPGLAVGREPTWHRVSSEVENPAGSLAVVEVAPSQREAVEARTLAWVWVVSAR